MTTRAGSPEGGTGLSRWRFSLARTVLFVEAAWPRLWPIAGLAGLFIALSLFDVWTFVTGWWHLAGLVGFAAAAAVLGYGRIRGLRWPTHDEARRRLEKGSGLSHRPIEALEDRLANPQAGDSANRLWRLHQSRMGAVVRRLRVGWPRAGLVRVDPWGVRAALGLILVVAVSVSGNRWEERMSRAFMPHVFGPAPAAAELDAWVTPPEYTGLPPLFLSRAARSDERKDMDAAASSVTSRRSAQPEENLKVPAGSVFMARVHGGIGAPTLTLNRQSREFDSLGGGSFQLKMALDEGGRLAIVQNNGEIDKWMVDVVADQAPTIAFVQPPAATNRLAVRIDYQAADDYGLAKASVKMRLSAGTDEMELPLALSGLVPKAAAETAYFDLTANPWAGLPVSLWLVAVDGTGQQGRSGELELVLPERVFHHPVARAVIEQRKILALQPERRKSVAQVLGALTTIPEQYAGDVVVHLALRSAMGRLLNDPEDGAMGAVQDLLWDTALRLEDGQLSLAERELRDIQRELAEALAQGAPDEEIERLMDKLQQALDRYLQALAEQAQRQAEQGQSKPLDPDARLLSGKDIQDMLNRARDLSRAGARDAAREMLSRLQQMLENLQAAVGRGQSPEQRQMEQGMRDLNDLMSRQQRLLDETFRTGRGERPGPDGKPGRPSPGQGQPSSPGDLAQRQEALRRMLGEIMRQFGEAAGSIPDALGRAERFMRDAREALGRQAPGEAVRPQGDALDQLRQGAQSMMQDMMQQMGRQGPGPGGPREGQAGEAPQDPLGRPLPGNWGEGGEKVNIPDQPDTQRARDILQELHRRAREQSRPPLERDYIDRLLKRF